MKALIHRPPTLQAPAPIHTPKGKRGVAWRLRHIWHNFLGFWGTACGVFFTVMVTPAVLMSRDGWGMRWAYSWFQRWGLLVPRVFGVRVWVKGMEHVDPNQAYVVVCNHRSHLDILMLGPVLRVFLVAIYKRSLDLVPFLGLALRLSRSIGLDRSDPTEAKRRLELVAHRLKLGRSVLIFAEGTRSRGPTLAPFKKGAAMIALEQGAPILPVTVVGTDAVFAPGRLFVDRGDVLVVIHPPVQTTGRPAQDKDALTAELRACIAGPFEAGPLNVERVVGAVRVV